MLKSKYQRLRREELKRASGEVFGIRASLCEAYDRFDTITDPELVDACVYEINALRSRYDHAIRRAKTILGSGGSYLE